MQGICGPWRQGGFCSTADGQRNFPFRIFPTLCKENMRMISSTRAEGSLASADYELGNRRVSGSQFQTGGSLLAVPPGVPTPPLQLCSSISSMTHLYTSCAAKHRSCRQPVHGPVLLLSSTEQQSLGFTIMFTEFTGLDTVLPWLVLSSTQQLCFH